MQNTSELQSKLALNLVKSDAQVIAAGPLTHQPHSRPYRIVLLNRNTEYSVHAEVFNIDDPQDDLAAACEKAESYFHEGNYFKAAQFVEAMERFIERLKRDQNHLPSIMRGIAA